MRNLAFIFVISLGLTACGHVGIAQRATGSGVIKTEHRNVGPFTGLDVGGAFLVDIVCGKEPGVDLEGDDNLLPLITTEVRNGVLRIGSESSIDSRNRIHVRVSTNDLNSLSSSGASEVNLSGVNNSSLKISVSGAGSLKGSGETKNLELSMSGAAHFDAQNLHASKVTVSISGAGNAIVYATDELDAKISGVGNISYYGNPKTINKDISGMGSLTAK